MHLVKNSPLRISHVALVAELVARASDRIQSLESLDAVDYARTLSEIQLITARINELIFGM
jgi:hypothetical protein